MRLSGLQIGEMLRILRVSFSRKEVVILVRIKLDMDLDDVTTNDGWENDAYGLIEHLNEIERIVELIRAIREARPNDSDLIAFCDPFLAQAGGATPPPSADAVRRVAAAFNDGFQKRSEIFNYINSYKELHDILHEIQVFHPRIEQAVAERRADPSRPLAEDVALSLEEHVKNACENAKDIEFPDKPPAWIARLVTAAGVLNGPDVEKMPRQVERLRTLPSEGLGPLNDKLFENARRLEPEQLIGSLDGILAALGTGGNPATANLRREVEKFRSLCSELDEWIKAHNLCQAIDDALREAEGLPAVTPEELSDWGIVKKSLDELALLRRDDNRVKHMVEAARSFEAANQGFLRLREGFDNLFKQIDESLLKVTNKLPRKALDLHKALEEFQ